MAYCSQDDIQDQIPVNELISLTDDDGFGVVDSTVVERAIMDAEAVIDAYCQNRYSVPFDPAPAIIRRICVDLAIHNLLSRRAVEDLPKVREGRKIDAYRFLEKVATGTILLGAATPEPTVSPQAVTINGPERVFSRDRLTGY